MKIHCTPRFKQEYEKLCQKKPYRSLSKTLFNYFFDKTIEEITSGIRVFPIPGAPYIKKRIDGSGGYRMDFQVIQKNGEFIIIFVYPKTGPDGTPDLDMAFRKELLNDLIDCRERKDLFEVIFNPEDSSLHFTHIGESIS